MKIKKRTVRRLRIAASKFFPPEQYGVDPYHTWLESEYGVESTLDLTEAQAVEAIKSIDRMSKEERQSKREKAKENGAADRLTVQQEDYIKGLFHYLGIKEKHRQIGFIDKQIGNAKVVQWLTPSEASKVITGLKRWKRDEKKENSK